MLPLIKLFLFKDPAYHIHRLASAKWEHRLRAAKALGELRDARATGALTDVLRDGLRLERRRVWSRKPWLKPWARLRTNGRSQC